MRASTLTNGMYTGIQVYRYTGVQLDMYTSIEVYKYISIAPGVQVSFGAEPPAAQRSSDGIVASWGLLRCRSCVGLSYQPWGQRRMDPRRLLGKAQQPATNISHREATSAHWALAMESSPVASHTLMYAAGGWGTSGSQGATAASGFGPPAAEQQN